MVDLTTVHLFYHSFVVDLTTLFYHSFVVDLTTLFYYSFMVDLTTLFYHIFVIDLTTFILPQFCGRFNYIIIFTTVLQLDLTTLILPHFCGRSNHIDFTTLLPYLIILYLQYFWYNTSPINITQTSYSCAENSIKFIDTLYFLIEGI